MKTNILIAAMLTLAVTVSAQSAHRSTKPETKKTASTETRTVRSTAPTRQTTVSHSGTQTTSRSQQPSNVSKGRSVQQGHGTTSTVRKETDNRNVQTFKTPEKRSTYTSTDRSANQTVHNGKTYVDPKPGSNAAYRPANQNSDWHRVYTNSKVKHYYHNDTRSHNYRVMYYPRYSEVIWTRGMHRLYLSYYPYYTGWHYHYGYRVQTVSSFDAAFNIGEVARVYGRVYSTWYNNEADEYLLFFGGEYPYQHLTVVVPGKIARRYSWRPENYFLGQHVIMTGLITSYEGKPEMVIRSRSQFSVY